MKRHTFYLVMCGLLWQSCTKSDRIEPVTELDNHGFLAIAMGEPDIDISHGRQTEDYTDAHVSIISLSGGENVEYASIGDVPDSVELEVGNYYVHAYTDSIPLPAFDAASYVGNSELFPIGDDSLTHVEVDLGLNSVKVEVNYSENVQTLFYDYHVEVFDEHSGSLYFGKNETRKGYFIPCELTIHAVLHYVNSSSDSTSIEKMVSVDGIKNDFLIITVDGDLEFGEAIFDFNLDSLNVREIDIVF